jgi:hypothetical protein
VIRLRHDGWPPMTWGNEGSRVGPAAPSVFFGQHDRDDAPGYGRVGRIGRVVRQVLIVIIDLEKDRMAVSLKRAKVVFFMRVVHRARPAPVSESSGPSRVWRLRSRAQGRIRRRLDPPRCRTGRPNLRLHPVGGQADQELERQLARLREDQRSAKADVALIVSQALPKGLQAFDFVDGVWVTEPRYAVAVAIALRESLIALSAARLAGEGQQTKMELVYQYLTGPRFRHRIEAVVERFTDMQADLDSERKAMMRLWAKREEQIRGVVEATAGLYGDLQGIAGRSLLEIDGLEVPMLDGPAGIEAAE